MLYKTRCKYIPVRSAEAVLASDGLVKHLASPPPQLSADS